MKKIAPVIFLFFLFSHVQAQINLVPFAAGFTRVTDIKHCGDERLFIVEQNGFIRISDLDGNINPVPFLNIQSQIVFGGEQGLLGLAFSPNYKTDGMFYVNYTGSGGHTRISRFRASPSNPDSASVSSEEVLLFIIQPYVNHNGGALQFGKDGYLYCALGDGGGTGDPENNAQNPLDTLGKILRIDVNTDSGFVVPPSNPFYNNPDTLELIWALGLRNPWRISFDRLTGDLWNGDVGQGNWEEINFQDASSSGGEHYGWRCYEGTLPFNLTGCNGDNYISPVYQYPHGGPIGGCSVTGGYVYRGAKYKNMFGKYFFVDYCADDFYSFSRNSSGNWTTPFLEHLDGGYGFGTFGEDVYGEMYVGGINIGSVFRLEGVSCGPLPFFSFEDTIRSCSGSAELTALYNPALSYQWKKNGNLIAGATSNKYTANQGGHYSVIVANDSCSNESGMVYFDNCIDISNNVVIAPNPVSDDITLLIKSYIDYFAEIEIYDTRGKLCISKTISLYPPGAERYKIPVPQLSQGMYIIKVKGIEFSYSGRFIVTKP